MSDLCAIVDYITEAEQHIRQAESLLTDLEKVQMSEARRLRACTYIAAMKRLKRMIETHSAAAEVEAAASPESAVSGQPRFLWWLAPSPAIEAGVFRRRTG